MRSLTIHYGTIENYNTEMESKEAKGGSTVRSLLRGICNVE